MIEPTIWEQLSGSSNPAFELANIIPLQSQNLKQAKMQSMAQTMAW